MTNLITTPGFTSAPETMNEMLLMMGAFENFKWQTFTMRSSSELSHRHLDDAFDDGYTRKSEERCDQRRWFRSRWLTVQLNQKSWNLHLDRALSRWSMDWQRYHRRWKGYLHFLHCYRQNYRAPLACSLWTSFLPCSWSSWLCQHSFSSPFVFTFTLVLNFCLGSSPFHSHTCASSSLQP